MFDLFTAFVRRERVRISTPHYSSQQSVEGFINHILKEDGSPNRNFIVTMSDGKWIYFRLPGDVTVTPV